jgi:Tc toxin complex TcA C-terminal TcB-binding domain
MSLFDRDFPGHYLRLIKDVSLTVVALVPPAEAVHATLSNNGVSRVIAGLPFDQRRVVQRQSESIAVTAAANATGLFELRLDDPILLPFEGAGVDTTWSLEMPKGANRFDLSSLADVLLTVRYTAFDDVTYREKVLKQLGMTSNRELSTGGMASFSLRTAFPDEWFDVFHPEFADPSDYGFESGKIKPPYLMQFELGPGDFPPNEQAHALARLNVAFRQSRPIVVPIEVWFSPVGKTDEYALTAEYDWDVSDATSGPISVSDFSMRRTGPTATWQTVPTPMAQLSPFGTWRVRLRNEDAAADLVDSQEHQQNKLDLDWLDDGLFVLAYDARVDYLYPGAA